MHKFSAFFLVALAFMLLPGLALAAPVTTGNEFVTQTPGLNVVGHLTMCLNSSGQAIPAGSGCTQGLPVTAAGPTPGSASIASGQVTVAATSTQVVAARAGRVSVSIENLGIVDVWCGVSGVTATTGHLLLGVKGGALTIPTQDAVFCVATTGTQAVSFLEAF